jgi:hypothetical protein
MPYTAKAGVLWVLAATALGCVPFVFAPSMATFGLVWVGAALGVLGALSHALVALLAPEHVFVGFASMAVIVYLI